MKSPFLIGENMSMQDYRIYEHIIGLPDYLDMITEEIEECLSEHTADEAEEFISQNVSPVDKYGRERRVYVFRIRR